MLSLPVMGANQVTKTDGCMQKTAGDPEKATHKVASGIVVYLMEELGDARLRCAQLKKQVKEATDLIEKSEHRDHFFEVAGHLIHGIPDTLLRMDKALDASALAAARLDYEEIKQGLKPEKADELEEVLQDVRLRYLNRRSTEGAPPEVTKTASTPRITMNAKTAAEVLNMLADDTDRTGKVPEAPLTMLIASLERGRKTAAGDNHKQASEAFRVLAKQIEADAASGKAPSPLRVAGILRRIVGDTMEPTARFEEGKPADPTEKMTPEQKAEWEKNTDKYKDKFKS